MDRLERLKKIFENVDEDKKTLVSYAINELVYLENQLNQLKQYPFILYNKRTGDTKATHAAKQFKELEQSYLNCLKVLIGVLRNSDGEEEDAFDKWLKENKGDRE